MPYDDIDPRILELLQRRRPQREGPDYSLMAGMAEAAGQVGTLGGRAPSAAPAQRYAQTLENRRQTREGQAGAREAKLASYLSQVGREKRGRERQLADRGEARGRQDVLRGEQEKRQDLLRGEKEKRQDLMLAEERKRQDVFRGEQKKERELAGVAKETQRQERRQEEMEDYGKKQKMAYAAKKGPEPTGKYAKLETTFKKMGAEEAKKANQAIAAFASLREMRQALAKGINTFSLVGKNEFTLARDIFVQSFGRLESGAVIGEKELTSFENLMPKKGDTVKMQALSIKRMAQLLGARLLNAGIDPRLAVERMDEFGRDYDVTVAEEKRQRRGGDATSILGGGQTAYADSPEEPREKDFFDPTRKAPDQYDVGEVVSDKDNPGVYWMNIGGGQWQKVDKPGVK